MLQCRTRLHPHLHLSASHRNCPPIEKVHPDSSVAMATKVAHTSITLLPALTQPTEELVEHANEVTEVEVPVSHHTLNLVELSKVGGIQGLIAKHPVNGEVFGGSESLLSELVEHAGTDGCCVRAHNVLLSLLQLPVILVTGRGRGGVSGREGKGGVSGGGKRGVSGGGRDGVSGRGGKGGVSGGGRGGVSGRGGKGGVSGGGKGGVREGRAGSVGEGGAGSVGEEGRAGSVGEGGAGSVGEEGRVGSVGEGGAGSVGEEGRVGTVGEGGTGSKTRRLFSTSCTHPCEPLPPLSCMVLTR